MLRPAVRNGCIILVYLKYSDNGQCAGCAIAEICHIPYYELFSANKEKAEQEAASVQSQTQEESPMERIKRIKEMR